MGCLFDDVLDLLFIWFFVRSIGMVLEVNGGRISLLEEVSLMLWCDRVDMELLEVMYLSIDNLCISGLFNFEVLYKEEVLLSGVFE